MVGENYVGESLGKALANRPVLIKLPNGKIVALIRKSDGSTESREVWRRPSGGQMRRPSWRELNYRWDRGLRRREGPTCPLAQDRGRRARGPQMQKGAQGRLCICGRNARSAAPTRPTAACGKTDESDSEQRENAGLRYAVRRRRVLIHVGRHGQAERVAVASGSKPMSSSEKRSANRDSCRPRLSARKLARNSAAAALLQDTAEARGTVELGPVPEMSSTSRSRGPPGRPARG